MQNKTPSVSFDPYSTKHVESSHHEQPEEEEPHANPGLRPMPLHLAASELIGRQFKPSDLSRSRNFAIGARGRSSSDGQQGNTPVSSREAAKNILAVSGFIQKTLSGLLDAEVNDSGLFLRLDIRLYSYLSDIRSECVFHQLLPFSA